MDLQGLPVAALAAQPDPASLSVRLPPPASETTEGAGQALGGWGQSSDCLPAGAWWLGRGLGAQ